MLDYLCVRAMVEGGQSFNDGQTDVAIDGPQLSAIGGSLPHHRYPTLECIDATGSQLRHGSMDIGEDVELAIRMAFPFCGEVLPSVAEFETEHVETPEQCRSIANAHAQRAHRCEERPVIDLQCSVVLAKLYVKQRLVPPDVYAVQVVLRRPEWLAFLHPAEPVIRAAHHLHDVRDAMVRPVAEWLEFSSRACGVLGARILAGLLQSEGVEGLDDPVALLSLGPARQRACRSVSRPGKTAEVSVHLQRRHVGDEVERMTHEVPVEDCDRRRAVPFHRVR